MSLHSSFENEGITLPTGLLSPHADEVLTPVTVPAAFIPNLPPLTLPSTSLPPGPSGLPSTVSPQTISNIASSIQSLSIGQQTTVERSASRNSYSPAMSDSGISVDAGSNASGVHPQQVNVAALAKLGTVSVNQQGITDTINLDFVFE